MVLTLGTWRRCWPRGLWKVSLKLELDVFFFINHLSISCKVCLVGRQEHIVHCRNIFLVSGKSTPDSKKKILSKVEHFEYAFSASDATVDRSK